MAASMNRLSLRNEPNRQVDSRLARDRAKKLSLSLSPSRKASSGHDRVLESSFPLRKVII